MLSERLQANLQKLKSEMAPIAPAVTVATPIPGKIVVPTTPKVANPPSDKQINYFLALVDKKQLDEAKRKQLRDAMPTFDKRQMMNLISWLTGLPWQPRPVTPQAPRTNFANIKIAAGCYAIVHPKENVLRFYEVSRPDEGRWAGYVFLSQLSGENHVPMRDRVERDLVYAEIGKDPIKALMRYGKEIGRCGHCNKQLTDAQSREIGIGPVCRKSLGL